MQLADGASITGIRFLGHNASVSEDNKKCENDNKQFKIDFFQLNISITSPHTNSKMKNVLFFLLVLTVFVAVSEAGLCSWVCRKVCNTKDYCETLCTFLCTDPLEIKTYSLPALD
ncbi:hypothetical protein CEXT_23721 [Caerostris extrusa]|uniref:Uncharacterized protein n=1 Tax=Caerostris extrusa TaxID=172846 RepID=A0AAV4PEC9_CAEEX|nr:hypothetical protein CEXT_23721 [Caerostris extrusa]